MSFVYGQRVHDALYGGGVVRDVRSHGVYAVKFDRAGTLHMTEGCLTPEGCIVCGAILIENPPQEDRWSWGPDGAHCHRRCEAGFWDALAKRTAPPISEAK